MAEKNIFVRRGIPMGGGGGPISLSPTYFGSGWYVFSNADESVGFAGGQASVSINGAKRGPQAIPQNPFYLMQSVLEESVAQGNGWLPFEAYEDLGLDFWDTAPVQVFEFRREIAGKFDFKRTQAIAALNAETHAQNMTDASIEAINNTLRVVQKKLAEWEDALRASVAKMMQNPAKDYLGRTINDIVADLKKIDEYDTPAAIDQELAGFSDACDAANNMVIRDLLSDQNDSLVDNRSIQQALAQAKLMAKLSAQDQARELARQPLFDSDYLRDKEGGLQTTAYVPMDHGVPLASSGVTVGAGVDLGSKTAASLLSDGVAPELVSILAEYTGLRGQQAENKLQLKPLKVTDKQAKELTDIYHEKLSSTIERRYNQVVGADSFRRIPYNTRTAIIDLAFQYGDNLPAATPKTWQMILDKDWSGLIKELNNFGDIHPTRRKAEAALVKQDLDMGLFR